MLPEASVDVACMTQPSMVSSILRKNISVRKVPGFGITVLQVKEAATGSKHVTCIACFFPLIIL